MRGYPISATRLPRLLAAYRKYGSPACRWPGCDEPSLEQRARRRYGEERQADGDCQNAEKPQRRVAGRFGDGAGRHANRQHQERQEDDHGMEQQLRWQRAPNG